MGPKTKRTTVTVRDQMIEAITISRFLKARGIDVKVVTKHAVQIHPDHAAKTKDALKDFSWDWEKRAENERRRENADRAFREPPDKVA